MKTKEKAQKEIEELKQLIELDLYSCNYCGKTFEIGNIQCSNENWVYVSCNNDCYDAAYGKFMMKPLYRTQNKEYTFEDFGYTVGQFKDMLKIARKVDPYFRVPQNGLNKWGHLLNRKYQKFTLDELTNLCGLFLAHDDREVTDEDFKDHDDFYNKIKVYRNDRKISS
jgi:hypothetical protein